MKLLGPLSPQHSSQQGSLLLLALLLTRRSVCVTWLLMPTSTNVVAAPTLHIVTALLHEVLSTVAVLPLLSMELRCPAKRWRALLPLLLLLLLPPLLNMHLLHFCFNTPDNFV